MDSYSERLSAQLAAMGELYGLDTVETEELTQLASMATATPSQNTAEARKMFMAGLKEFETTTHNPRVFDAAARAALQSEENVRYAAVVRRHGKPVWQAVYLGGA